MDTKSNDDSAGSDSLDKSMQIKCVMVETTGDSNVDTIASPEELDNCSRDSAAESMDKGARTGTGTGDEAGAGNQANQKTEAAAGTQGKGDSPPSSQSPPEHPASNSPTSSCTAFETKVKLISQNLKETTLAESSGASVSASTSVSSNSSLLEPQTPNNSTTDTESAASNLRVKKVRFHPDVKENDGGNWVKKKRRSSHSKRASSPSGANCDADGMELDGEAEEYEDNEDEEEEPEEEFDLAKTIAEAEDYLKQHPLTFVQRVEQNGERLQDGLLSIEDMLNEVGEEVVTEFNDEDFFRRIKPENGIERILGKETKAGKVEFLLRYENQGLFWESEEFIKRTCPSLLKAYEKNRERRQQRLMHHVAKRQSLRQRYTDF
ncbi:uncharacterized protein LOC128261820 [Drosophila gunungcola]|uniref:uncharacterized protein LOC128261820 n=1 Tax=Drosophila gunungcola TaxID=103775 RepID=UPI0022E2511D|nr:uncharacterized protein LOC128261820 [Drosophila gunungcola]